MKLHDDTYKTIAAATEELLYKEKKSKFYSIAYPIQTEAEVKPLIEALKKKRHTANHVCYAWQLGLEEIRYRANDDGEPNNSAGMPIYGQILAYDLKNVLVAVTRIFGGTKLGVGGLISAYRFFWVNLFQILRANESSQRPEADVFLVVPQKPPSRHLG